MPAAVTKAGKAMDHRVAEKVFGLTMPKELTTPYSTDVAAAWTVVEKMREWSHVESVSIQSPYTGEAAKHYIPADEWTVFWDQRYPNGDGHGEYISADTAPLAICLAALAALEAD